MHTVCIHPATFTPVLSLVVGQLLVYLCAQNTVVRQRTPTAMCGRDIPQKAKLQAGTAVEASRLRGFELRAGRACIRSDV